MLIDKYKGVKRSSIFLLTFPRHCFFCGSFLLFVFRVRMLSCRFLAALWSPAWKGRPLGFLVLMFFSCVLSLSNVVSCVIVSIPDLCLQFVNSKETFHDQFARIIKFYHGFNTCTCSMWAKFVISLLLVSCL